MRTEDNIDKFFRWFGTISFPIAFVSGLTLLAHLIASLQQRNSDIIEIRRILSKQ